MTRYLMALNSPRDRRRAASYVEKAPYGTRVEFKAAKRTLDQNSRMWAMLSDVAEQVPWHGMKLRPGDWKLMFMAALRQEMRMVPNIDGTGFVNLGVSTSDLSKAEMSDLIELIRMFGAKNNVVFADDNGQTS